MRRALFASILMLACASGDDPDAERPELRTHVGDWRDQVIYQIVVDRFANGDTSNDVLDGIGPEPDDLVRHQGGDWEGITERLDYVKALGGTAIWLSPLVANVDRTEREDGYHGYWGTDFTRPNPRYGDLRSLRRLVRRAHEAELLVIVDVVTNHAGRVFSYDLDSSGTIERTEIEPPYRAEGYDVPLVWTHDVILWDAEQRPWQLGGEHFRRRGLGDVSIFDQKIYGDFPTGLRDLDASRADVMDALVATYVRWVEETDVDGFRIDAVPHVEDEFWPEFGTRIRRELGRRGKRDFLLMGEVFTRSAFELARYTGETGTLDTVFDFKLKFDVVDGVLLDGRAPSTAVPALETDRAGYRPFEHPDGIGLSPWEARVLIADNHDTWRLRGELDRFDSAALALLLVLAGEGIPCLYYGTEQELVGQGGGESRERLWDTGYRRDTETFVWIRKLVDLRMAHEALRRGTQRVRFASENDGRSDEPDAGMLAIERAFEDDRLVVAMNAHALQRSAADVPTGFAVGATLRNLLDDADPRRWEVGPGGLVAIELGPREAVMLSR
ncbi:MAG: alpha-amylase family glycosyl hydrolase [Polyangiales bacterium]|nr:hypothetical protein [Myxococcales bacterium]